MLLNSQNEIRNYETAKRDVVGLAQDYPAGMEASFHSHPRAQLLYAVSGVMNLETRTVSYIIPPNTAIILPADTEHSIYMDGAVAMKSLFFRKSAASSVCKTTKVIAVTTLLRELIIAACSEPLNWKLNGRGYLVTQLALTEIKRSTILPIDLPMPLDSRLRRVVESLMNEPSSKKTIADWAEIAYTSERTLTRLFRSETGLSFRQWRQQARLTAAMRSLTTGLSPTQASTIAGFNNQPAFGVAFRKLFGMTPGQARLLMKC
jgi:AraC-like DNA-binding protein